MGWANHRANRLVDLAALTFRFSEASAIAQGVEWSALHSFGCTAPKVAKQIKGTKKVPRFGFPRNNFKEYKIKTNILKDRKEPKIKRYNTKKEIPLK